MDSLRKLNKEGAQSKRDAYAPAIRSGTHDSDTNIVAANILTLVEASGERLCDLFLGQQMGGSCQSFSENSGLEATDNGAATEVLEVSASRAAALFEGRELSWRRAVYQTADELARLVGESVPRAKSASSAAPRPRKARPAQQMMRVSRPMSRGNTALAQAFEIELEPAPIVYDTVVPMSQRVSLLELNEATCHWPVGDPASPDFFFCGGKTLAGLPYCALHSRVAYQPAADRRRQPPKPTK